MIPPFLSCSFVIAYRKTAFERRHTYLANDSMIQGRIIRASGKVNCLYGGLQVNALTEAFPQI